MKHGSVLDKSRTADVVSAQITIYSSIACCCVSIAKFSATRTLQVAVPTGSGATSQTLDRLPNKACLINRSHTPSLAVIVAAAKPPSTLRCLRLLSWIVPPHMHRPAPITRRVVVNRMPTHMCTLPLQDQPAAPVPLDFHPCM